MSDATTVEKERQPESPPETAGEPIVQVRELTKDYGETLAVQDVSFDVHRGEIFGLIGPNGAGKTTTIRILSTLLEPTSGEVRIGGFCAENEADKVRAIIGYMPDAFGVYDGNTVEEYLEFFAGAYKLPLKMRASVVADVMALTDLTHLKGRMVSDLSRGMKQRLCLAKTLVHDPQVLILDEPASALDPRARVEMRALLKELGRMGKTVLISSHILTELSDLCSSVAIIEKGRLVESGNVEVIQSRHRGGHSVRIRLHEPYPQVEALLRRSPQVSSVTLSDDEVRFEYDGRPEHFHRVVKILTDNEVPFLSVEQRSRDLEGLFMELTEGDVQ